MFGLLSFGRAVYTCSSRGKFMQHIFQHTQAAVKIKLHGCYKFGDGGRSWSQILLRLFKNSDCGATPALSALSLVWFKQIYKNVYWHESDYWNTFSTSCRWSKFRMVCALFPRHVASNFVRCESLAPRYSQLLSTNAIICASIGRLRLKIECGGCFSSRAVSVEPPCYFRLLQRTLIFARWIIICVQIVIKYNGYSKVTNLWAFLEYLLVL